MQPNFFYELTLRRKYIAYNKLNNPKNNITSQPTERGTNGVVSSGGAIVFFLPCILDIGAYFCSSANTPKLISEATVWTVPLATRIGAVE